MGNLKRRARAQAGIGVERRLSVTQVVTAHGTGSVVMAPIENRGANAVFE